jgi:hypothetical protein
MIRSIAVALSLSVVAVAAQAEPTRVTLRAQALDAKFIGDHMGGVRITLTDARTGAVLARGVTTGGTGDTARIMKAPRARGVEVTDKDTAEFQATLDLKQPTLVRADAEGPVGKPGSMIRVTSSLWVLPGHDILGDGWVMTFPGLVVEPVATPNPDRSIRVTAKVSLMCGCPIEPGGVWDAANYTIDAMVLDGGKVVARAPLSYAGQPSQFAALLPAIPPGRYRLQVTAADARSPNAGLGETVLRVSGGR